jgi:hypothetical protein
MAKSRWNLIKALFVKKEKYAVHEDGDSDKPGRITVSSQPGETHDTEISMSDVKDPFVLSELSEHPVEKFMKSVIKSPDAFDIYAQLVECKRFQNGKLKYRTKEYRGTKQVIESVRKAKDDYDIAIKESGFDTGDSWSSSIGTGAIGHDYIQLMGGPWSKQLYLYDYLAMHAYCWWLKNHNGLAKFYIELITNFVLGDGIRVTFDDEKVQSEWEDYCNRTDWQNRFRMECDEATTFGELMYQKSVMQSGDTILRTRDPSTCLEIVTKPEDVDWVHFYHFQFPTQYQMFARDEIPGGKFIIEQVPADQIMHRKLNVVSNEKRGRSDLFSAMHELKQLRDYVHVKALRAYTEAKMVWDVTVDGDSTDVNNAAAAKALHQMEPGATFAHNKKVELKAVTPSGIGSGADKTFDALMSLVAIVFGVPITYFGIISEGGSSPARASAVITTEPVGKKLKRRQEFFIPIAHKKVEVWKESRGFKNVGHKITMPELQLDERSAKIKDLVIAYQQGALTDEQLCTNMATELRIRDYNYEEVRKETEQRKHDQEHEMEVQNNPMSARGVDRGKVKDQNR